MHEKQRSFAILKHDLQYRLNRLREEIDDLDDNDHLMVLVDEPEEHEKPRTAEVMHESDTVIGYFIIADEALKLLERELFEEKLVKEEFRDETIVNEFGDESRINTMKHFDLFGEYQSDVETTHEFRNDLAHNASRILSNTSISKLESKLESSWNAVNGLEDIVWDDVWESP